MSALDDWYRRTTEDIQAKRDKLEGRARQAYLEGTQQLAHGREFVDRALNRGGAAVDQLKVEYDRQVQKLTAPNPSTSPPPNLAATGASLRGPIGVTRPPQRYVADLTNPGQNPHLGTRVDATHSRLDAYPASNLVMTSMPVSELREKVRSMLAGKPVDLGPHITFKNDVAGRPDTDVPLTTESARMITAAFLDSGARSININSSTGGHKANPGSRHNSAQAVDINSIDGVHVGASGEGLTKSRNLQDAFMRQPNIREDFGPSYLYKMPGRTPVRSQQVIDGHKDHVHFAGRK